MVAYPILWSPTAKANYYQILEYLNDNWTIKELEAFVKRTEEVISHIYKNPSLYPYSESSDTHKCVVVKQVTLFYRVTGESIQLLVFWDSRQNPAKLVL